jgi:zinc transporter, ZIP family
MSAVQTSVLGAIAGATIFIGLPAGRLRAEQLSERTRWLLATISVGILLFIFWDVMSASIELVEEELPKAGHGSWPSFGWQAALLCGGFAIGAFGIHGAQRLIMRRRPLPPAAGGEALAAVETPEVGAIIDRGTRAALTLGMLIAAGIGVHNFSEGLAIGVSARAGEVALAGTLIIGFALHNATEGFGIVGPLHGVRPSWRWLGAAGLVGGGPTFLGTLVGYRVDSEPLQLAFLALAGGAILFVIGELWGAASRRVATNVVLVGIVVGFLLGLGGDLVIEYAGG